MEIRAIGTLVKLPVLILGTTIITSACSLMPWSSSDSDAENQTASSPWADSSTAQPAETAAPAPAAAMEAEPVPVENIRIKADYPRQYIVKKGDTLWDIAAMFLHDPWYWPEIWYRNPQVQNPHLIYPGDVLTLIYVDGRPQIQLSRAADGSEVVRIETPDKTADGLKITKLIPQARRTSLQAQIPTIPSDAIRQFLSRPNVVTKEQIDEAPYIVSSDEAHLILGADNRIYIRGELNKDRVRYGIYRRGEAFRDPETGEVLGYEVIYAGEARIDRYGNPATATITDSNREVLVGDMLMDTDASEINYLFYPKLPREEVQGQIISLFDAISSVASYQIVVINRGSEDGIDVGHVLATYYKGGEARDRYLARKQLPRGEAEKLMVTLPNERSGLMIIFKVFDRVSYGLIVESTRVIRRNDLVENPR